MSKSALNVGDLERILDERKAALQDLVKRRDAAQKTLDDLDAEIQGLLGPGRGLNSVRRRRRRVKNERSLRAVVLDVLKGSKSGFKLADLATKVAETGYKTTSRNFRNVLYQCLYNTESSVHDSKTGCYKLQKV